MVERSNRITPARLSLAGIEVLGRNVRRITLRSAKNPIAIYYEHPRWFQPVFDELERRGVPYVLLDATRHHFGIVTNGNQQFVLVFNRMSPSAWTRGHAQRYFLHPKLPHASRTDGSARHQW
jgi:hypothetical protein